MKKHCYMLFSVACLLLSTMALAQSMNPSQFQAYVVKYLNSHYKQYAIDKSSQADVISLGGVQVSLDTLFAAYHQGQIPEDALDGVIKNYFEPMMAEVNSPKLDHSEWRQVKEAIRPQLAPISYLQRANLVHQKLDDNLIATFVVDDARSYKYVTDAYLKKWQVSVEELVNVANQNLINISANMPMNISTEGDKFIIIQAKDGYDAARIMVPQIRQFVAQHLGEQYYAAMPYRDILLLWSGSNSDGFKATMAKSIQEDFAAKQYALSPNIFKVSAQGIKVVEATGPAVPLADKNTGKKDKVEDKKGDNND